MKSLMLHVRQRCFAAPQGGTAEAGRRSGGAAPAWNLSSAAEQEGYVHAAGSEEREGRGECRAGLLQML